MAARNFTREDFEAAKAWPFAEARALIKRLEKIEAAAPAGSTSVSTGERPVLFQTGYGPSGPPHIGTFGEVVRTTMVRRAFEALTGRATKLICFSDDMDGMRKVPPQLPNRDRLEPHLQKPLTSVPNPFDTDHPSFAHHNNAALRAFLDRFGFDYDFYSATERYRSGAFDATMLKVLEHYDAVMDIILPTLGADRRETYSPILPISPTSGRVLYVPILEFDPASGRITFEDEDGARTEGSVLGGQAKLQWKADWAGRWVALGVDYEMSGEDLTESVRLSSRIARALGAEPPAGFNYQLFLDEEGKKISKTKGNGISIDEWLTYASSESLALFMFQNPKAAKKLYFDIIPKTADEYWSHVEKFAAQDGARALDNPAWHIHEGAPPDATPPVSYGMLLTLVSAVGSADADLIRGFVRKYRPDADEIALAEVDRMIAHARAYFDRFVAPNKSFRAPTAAERAALAALSRAYRALGDGASEDDFQTATFTAGKDEGFENIRDWFRGLYEVVFGQSEGPRMGPFAKIYGAAATADLIDEALARD
ncbi:MAG: lysine--tRNA ligase [Alphaproteobacteria bacterium]|nr:lysine--tRNA ligase [Alphaproteobacteria bacterium]